MNITWGNSLVKVVKVKVTYTSYLGNVFESLTKKIQSFEKFKNFPSFRSEL